MKIYISNAAETECRHGYSGGREKNQCLLLTGVWSDVLRVTPPFESSELEVSILGNGFLS